MRVKKKSDSDLGAGGAGVGSYSPPTTAAQRDAAADIDPAAAAAVLGEAPAASGGGRVDDFDDVDREDSIYEVMKQKLIEQREELENRNAQLRQQAQQAGRPAPRPTTGYGRAPAAPATPAPMVEKVTDYANLVGVWMTARKHLVATGSKYIEDTLTHAAKLESLDQVTWEATIWIPPSHRNWANEKTRVKLEESLRAVTGKGIRVGFHCPDPVPGQEGEASRFVPGAPSGPSANSQRVPPEVVDAVKNQPVVRELMKRLDATVVNIELIDNGD